MDIVTDGEQRRESYFNQFATALEGVDPLTPGTAINRVGKPQAVPRIVGPVARARPVLLHDVRFLRAITRRRIKVTIPGPFTMTQLAQDEHYRDPERLAMAYADAVNAELAELEPLVDVLQLDEPYMQAQPDRARAYAVPAIDRALRGLRKTTVVHLCFGYAFSVKDKPSGYSFLPELDRCAADQISIEAAQPGLDPSVLAALPSKTMVLGVLGSGLTGGGVRRHGGATDRRRARPSPRLAAGAGARLRHEAPAPSAGAGEAGRHGGGRAAGGGRALRAASFATGRAALESVPLSPGEVSEGRGPESHRAPRPVRRASRYGRRSPPRGTADDPPAGRSP